MNQLSVPVDKEEYTKFDGQLVTLPGGQEVTVLLDHVRSRSGSFERGFKFGSITYGILVRCFAKTKMKSKRSEFSADHGTTWHPDLKTAKKSKGKVIVSRSSNTEFAFNGIQKINRDYYGPSYRWKP